MNSEVDMDYLRINLEDSTAGTGFLVKYYERSRDLQAAQYHTVNGSKVVTNIYSNGNVQLSTNQWYNCKITIDPVQSTVNFDFNGVSHHYDGETTLDQAIINVNSIKIYLIEGKYKLDNIQVSTTAYLPYTYTDDFDSPELNGFAGPFVSYLYNTDDERVMKISPQGVTKYITDGNGQVLVENDGYNNLKYNYIYGNGQKLASINTSGTKEYYHNDYLGSVRRVSNSTGTVTWSRDYYPFGEIREATGANEDNHYNYEGKEKDLETDLWNNWNRHFNDEGRFTQVDLLWSKYPSLSPYVRVANNPLRFVDEDGKEILDINGNKLTYQQKLDFSFQMASEASKIGTYTPLLTSDGWPDAQFKKSFSNDNWVRKDNGIMIRINTVQGNRSKNLGSSWMNNKISSARLSARYNSKNNVLRVSLTGSEIKKNGELNKGRKATVFEIVGSLEKVEEFLNANGFQLINEGYDDDPNYEIIPYDNEN